MSETKVDDQGPGAGARLLIDLGPLIVFFVVNSLKGILAGTGAFMIAIIAALVISLTKYKKVSPLLWLSAIMVLVFGGLTIWLGDPRFIKIKPTIYYLTVSAVLAFGLATNRNILKMVLGSAYPGLSERGWMLLSRNFAVFFVLLAVANEFVWRTFSTDIWIGFKIYGAIPATLVFGAANMPMLIRHGLQLEAAKEEGFVPPTE
jgi:intracellular septation protein